MDTGLQELYLPLLVTAIHCTMWWCEKTCYASRSSSKCQYQWSWDKPYCPGCKQWCLMLQFGWEQALLKMCISKHCHKVTGFLLWIGTYCISCVVQQRSRVKDLFSLVGYDDSCLAEIRHVKSIIRVVQPRPHIRSHSVLFSLWSWHCIHRSFLNPGTLPPCYSRCTVLTSERSQIAGLT